MFSLESPHRGNSNEYTQYIIFNEKKDNCPKLSQICSYGIFPRDPRTSSKQPWQTSHQCSSHLSSTVLSRFSCSKVQIPPHYSRPKPIIIFLTICSSFSHKSSKFKSLNKIRSDQVGRKTTAHRGTILR